MMVLSDGPEYYQHILGCSLAFMSSVCSGLSTVLFTKLEIRNTDAYLTISGCAAMVYTLIFLLFNREFNFESLVTGQLSQVVLIICVNGVFSSVIGTHWYIKSMRRLSPVTVNVLWSLSIPLTVLVDYYRGSVHAITPAFLLGALLVLLSTVLVPIEQEETRLADTQLEYDIPLLIIEDDGSPNSARNTS
jgi:drug/metabolite transporter (DMT)-like permease